MSLDRIDSKNADLILIEGLDTPEFVEAFDIEGGGSYVRAIRR